MQTTELIELYHLKDFYGKEARRTYDAAQEHAESLKQQAEMNCRLSLPIIYGLKGDFEDEYKKRSEELLMNDSHYKKLLDIYNHYGELKTAIGHKIKLIESEIINWYRGTNE